MLTFWSYVLWAPAVEAQILRDIKDNIWLKNWWVLRKVSCAASSSLTSFIQVHLHWLSGDWRSQRPDLVPRRWPVWHHRTPPSLPRVDACGCQLDQRSRVLQPGWPTQSRQAQEEVGRDHPHELWRGQGNSRLDRAERRPFAPRSILERQLLQEVVRWTSRWTFFIRVIFQAEHLSKILCWT